MEGSSDGTEGPDRETQQIINQAISLETSFSRSEVIECFLNAWVKTIHPSDDFYINN